MSSGLRGVQLSKIVGLVALLVTLLALGASHCLAQNEAPAELTLRVVGGISSLNQFTQFEEPFWSRTLPQLSGGRYRAEIVAFDRAGVPGPDMLRLVGLGVVPIATALLSNISAQDPRLAAPDLAGLNPDMATLRKNLVAFRPYMEKSLLEQHGVRLLGVYTYPAQVIFCKNELKGLSDLSGRRVRVSSATQYDFVKGLNATPVLISLNQLVQNVRSGNTECAITGAMSGNTIGLHELTHYLYAMPVTWGLSVLIANQAAWDGLPADLRKLLEHELPRLENDIWAASERETSAGLECNGGSGKCQTGRPGNMIVLLPGGKDDSVRQLLLGGTVLPNWLQRCGTRCSAIWNQAIAPVNGVRASSRP